VAQIDTGQLGQLGSIALSPLAVEVVVLKAEGVVTAGEGQQGLVQAVLADGGVEGQQEVLVVMGGLLLSAVEIALLDGQQRSGTGQQPLFCIGQVGRTVPVAQQVGERCDGLVLEDIGGRELVADAAGAADDLDGDDGVAAELEEVVVEADAVGAEELLPDGGELLLFFGQGRAVALSGLLTGVEQGQLFAVDLSAGGERQVVEHDPLGREHIVGQALLEIALPGGLIGEAVGQDIGDEAFVAVVVGADAGGGQPDAGGLQQDLFDLCQLDAIAPDLDLVVEPAEVLDVAVGEPAGLVAGAVETGIGIVADGIEQEPFGGELGPVPVTAGDLDAADPQLPGHTDGNRLPPAVEDMQLGIGNGQADRDAVGGGDGLGDPPAGDIDGGLGGTIEIEQRDIGQLLLE